MLGSLILMGAVSLGAAPTAAPKDPLQPLQFLVSHCWAGDLPREMGRDTHCFEAMYGSHFIRDKHVVHGKNPDYLGETIYAFDPKQQRIVFSYWSSDGDMDSGSVEPVADGLNFPERHLTKPKDLIMRTRWKRVGVDHYEALNERKTGDGPWQAEWKVEYARIEEKK